MNEDPRNAGPLNIALVIDVYDDVRNGAVISTQRFAELLSKNHHVTVISTGEKKANKIIVSSFYPPLARKIMQQHDNVLAWPSKNLLEKVFKQFDVIHVQFPFFLSIRSIKIARRMNIPVVATFHVQAEHLLHNIGLSAPWIVNWTYKLFLKTIYNRCDAVICPSKFAQDELMHYGLNKPNYIISNGFLPIFEPKNIQRPENFNDYFAILSVGRLASEKHQEILIEAINYSKYKNKIKLILVGRGPLADKLKILAQKLPIPPLLEFSGVMPENMPYFYNIADLYVHTSTIEIECMAVLEAMACGLPLLVSNAKKSAAKQFALDQRSLFAELNPKELAEKIDYWIDHPNELTQAKELYRKSAQQYSIEQSVASLENVYRECIKHHVLDNKVGVKV